MDGNKVLEVIGIYRVRLNELGAIKEDYPHKKMLPIRGLRKHALGHCYGMLDTMETFIRSNRMEKCFRWLGFIQGVLWVLRIYTLEDLKNHNRPAE